MSKLSTGEFLQLVYPDTHRHLQSAMDCLITVALRNRSHGHLTDFSNFVHIRWEHVGLDTLLSEEATRLVPLIREYCIECGFYASPGVVGIHLYRLSWLDAWLHILWLRMKRSLRALRSRTFERLRHG